jgi:hypothetical protein
MKNLIIQYYIDVKKYTDPTYNNLTPSPLESYSSHSFKEYCRRYGHDYRKITEPKINFQHPTWERFDLWTDRSWWDKYDQIMYVDSDVVAFPWAPDIFSADNNNKAFKSPWYHKFRDMDQKSEERYRQKFSFLSDMPNASVRTKFIQPGVFIVNKNCTEHMLPLIEKYKDIKDKDINDGVFLNYCIAKSGVPLVDLDKRFNHKNNGQRMDYKTIYFLHAAGGKKHKKGVKLWKEMKMLFPDVNVDLSGLKGD